MKSFYLDRPLNFAHRGASYEAPENTLAAFLLAIELGADGIEFDVQLSGDDQIVVIHDFVLETTTDGAGPVRVRTLAELKELDAGRQFDAAFVGQQIPTLKGLLPDAQFHIIDHHDLHQSPPPGTVLSLSDTGATVTLLVEQIRELRIRLTSLEATLLLLGVYEDTGSLTYANTTARDLQAAAWLLSFRRRMRSSSSS